MLIVLQASNLLKQISKPANGHLGDSATRTLFVPSDSDSESDNDLDSTPGSMSCVNFAKVVNIENTRHGRGRHLQDLNSSGSENEEKLARLGFGVRLSL